VIFISTNWDGRPAEKTDDCFDAMAANLCAALGRNKTERCFVPLGPPQPSAWTIYVGYMKDVYRWLKVQHPPGARVAWMQEGDSSGMVDVSFHFTGRADSPKQVLIRAPFEPSLYVVEPKEKIVLVDHVSYRRDYTPQVLAMCENLPADWEVWLMSTVKPKEQIPLVVPPRVRVLPKMPMGEYLEQTSHVSAFVCTHAETYGYGVIDMAVRGTRVLAHKGAGGALNSWFGVQGFDSQESFCDLVTNQGENWFDAASRCQKLCTPYARIARIVANKFITTE
jgi:hypothetical protein